MRSPKDGPTPIGTDGLAIVAKNVRHTYDGKHFALDGVSFEVKKGEVFGLLGRNGAGKTTLIKALTTLIEPTSGSLEILGRNPKSQGSSIRKRIGVVQQGDSFDFTTVEGNMDIYGVLWGIPADERVLRRETLLKKFGLEDIRKKRAFDLSGGQKRRVQVAREFMHDMDILFLDEPTVGLDIIMRHTLLSYIRDEVKRGLTVVFTTHNLEEADYLCDRVAVVESGKILLLDTLENLKRLYGGKKTVEVSVPPLSQERFYTSLRTSLPQGSTMKVDGGSAIVLTDDTKAVLAKVLELSHAQGTALEWLNVRKNTLEDVFLDSVNKGGESHGTA